VLLILTIQECSFESCDLNQFLFSKPRGCVLNGIKWLACTDSLARFKPRFDKFIYQRVKAKSPEEGVGSVE
jgi:hypothetical protein